VKKKIKENMNNYVLHYKSMKAHAAGILGFIVLLIVSQDLG